MKVQHIFSTEQDRWQNGTVSAPQGNDTLSLTGEEKQEVKGFGGCFNELGWDALQKVSPEDFEAFFRELYSEDGCHFTMGRLPMGANDFSLGWYSCDETDGDYELKDFTIDRDRQYTIPYIREAMKYQPELMLFGSPWSPPTWMKTKKVYNYGRIRMEDAVLRAYAQYFVRFVEEYKKEGIKISQMHVQNEPMADQKFPSCLWYGEDMLVFVRDYLGPAFEKSGLDTQLWLGTINGPFNDFMMDNSDAGFGEFYDQFANTILSDEKARSYLTGVGLQWGGKHVIQQIRESYPELHYMQTESECGDGRNRWVHAEYIFNQMWIYFHNGIERYTYWNMALPEGGISTWGWRQNSLITVNEETGKMTWQPEYYLMKHLSHFVQPGARVLGVKGRWSSNTIAFRNPDGKIILLVGNSMNRTRTFCYEAGENSFSAEIPPHSFHTFVL